MLLKMWMKQQEEFIAGANARWNSNFERWLVSDEAAVLLDIY